jgi:hypothetical protein
MKKYILNTFLILFALFFLSFAIIEVRKNERSLFWIFSYAFGSLMFFNFLRLKIISMGKIKIEGNKIVKETIMSTRYLTIDQDFRIKYGIELIRLSGNGKHIFLGKDDKTSYNLLWDIYNIIKNNHCIYDDAKFDTYHFIHRPVRLLIVPFVIFTSICLIGYILSKTLIFIISLFVFIIILVIFFIMVSEETQIMDNSLVTKKFFKSKKYDAVSLSAVKLDVLQTDFKIYIRFYFGNKQILISTTGNEAGYYDFLRLFEVFDVYKNFAKVTVTRLDKMRQKP